MNINVFIDTRNTKANTSISAGLHTSMITGYVWLAKQPGFNPTDPPRNQFALRYTLKDSVTLMIHDYWKIYTLSQHEKSTLYKHLVGANLLTPAQLMAGFKLFDIIRRPIGILFQKTLIDRVEKSTVLALSPLPTPPAEAIVQELLADGFVVYDPNNPDPAMLERVPKWITDKLTAQATKPTPLLPQFIAPAIGAALQNPDPIHTTTEPSPFFSGVMVASAPAAAPVSIITSTPTLVDSW